MDFSHTLKSHIKFVATSYLLSALFFVLVISLCCCIHNNVFGGCKNKRPRLFYFELC
ncbi:unnamed protein product [Brassica rapa]|uniref:Uncharacterized protein n=1 Tax=Brassica campestris TaxID=3711 RepID=A0A8D9LXY7_BRACM|nr:unnamed protein product [Brassica rapa]